MIFSHQKLNVSKARSDNFSWVKEILYQSIDKSMNFSWPKENLFFKAKSKKFGHVCENSLYHNRLKLEWPKIFIFIGWKIFLWIAESRNDSSQKEKNFPSENISWLKEFGLAESEKEKVVTQSWLEKNIMMPKWLFVWLKVRKGKVSLHSWKRKSLRAD